MTCDDASCLGECNISNDCPGVAQITLTAPDKVTTDPGIVTVQFDNVLNEVRPQPSPSSQVCSFDVTAMRRVSHISGWLLLGLPSCPTLACGLSDW